MIMPRPPEMLQQRFTIDVAAWGDHKVREEVNLAGEVVPAGMWTDYGSVHKAVQWLVPKDGRGLPGYLVHDWLYKSQHTPRAYADRLLLEVHRWYGVPWWRRGLVYAVVRCGGWRAWKRNQKRKKHNA